MRPLIQEIATAHTPESLVENLRGAAGIVLLRTAAFDLPSARYSFVAANPFLTFRSSGSRCEISRHRTPDTRSQVQFGNPWQILDALMARFELLDEIDLPFPLGGCFGYWGYDLKNFTEPKLPRRAVNDLELPDCHVGFYDSLVVFDHQLGKVFVVSTGLNADGSRSETRAREQLEFWRKQLPLGAPAFGHAAGQIRLDDRAAAASWTAPRPIFPARISSPPSNAPSVTSVPATFTRSTFRNGSPQLPRWGEAADGRFIFRLPARGDARPANFRLGIVPTVECRFPRSVFSVS